ncbi:MAG: hypothetical protein WD509_00980 [Candidatus Paceibacterota bacterium]
MSRFLLWLLLSIACAVGTFFGFEAIPSKYFPEIMRPYKLYGSAVGATVIFILMLTAAFKKLWDKNTKKEGASSSIRDVLSSTFGNNTTIAFVFMIASVFASLTFIELFEALAPTSEFFTSGKGLYLKIFAPSYILACYLVYLVWSWDEKN